MERFEDLLTGDEDASADVPPADVLRLRLVDGSRVIVRPSGTEPKLKCYLEVRFTPEESTDGAAARIRGAGQLAALREEMARVLGI